VPFFKDSVFTITGAQFANNKQGGGGGSAIYASHTALLLLRTAFFSDNRNNNDNNNSTHNGNNDGSESVVALHSSSTQLLSWSEVFFANNTIFQQAFWCDDCVQMACPSSTHTCRGCGASSGCINTTSLAMCLGNWHDYCGGVGSKGRCDHVDKGEVTCDCHQGYYTGDCHIYFPIYAAVLLVGGIIAVVAISVGVVVKYCCRRKERVGYVLLLNKQ